MNSNRTNRETSASGFGPLSVTEFYSLWLIAVLTYGVGDTVTSIAILYSDSTVTEANVLLRELVSSVGLPGLVGLKIVVILICLRVSLSAVHDDEDLFTYYAPPYMLAVVGAFVTVFNARLLGV